MLPDFLEHDRELGEAQRENFRRALEAGVKLAVDADAGVCPYVSDARQFVYMGDMG